MATKHLYPSAAGTVSMAMLKIVPWRLGCDAGPLPKSGGLLGGVNPQISSRAGASPGDAGGAAGAGTFVIPTEKGCDGAKEKCPFLLKSPFFPPK